MFDIGFLELLVVLVVGLLVIGPERLPEVVRTVALYIGRFKRSLSETRAQIEREVGADDIRRQLHNEYIMRSLGESQQAIQRTLDEASDGIASSVHDVQTQLQDTENSIKGAADKSADAPSSPSSNSSTGSSTHFSSGSDQ